MKTKDTMILRASGQVARMHTTGRARPQNIAEHSWGVAMLVLAVRPTPSGALLRAALLHDITELRTGDTPAFVKWESPAIEAGLRVLETKFNDRFGTAYKGAETNPAYRISEDEEKVLKFCDGAELALYCIEELEGGNRHVLEMLQRIMMAIRNRGVPTECAELWKFIEKRGSNWECYPVLDYVYSDEAPLQWLK